MSVRGWFFVCLALLVELGGGCLSVGLEFFLTGLF